MNTKLSQKDIKTLKLGAVLVAAVIVLYFALSGYERWNAAKESFAKLQGDVDLLDMDKAKSSGLLRIVPAFEMPVEKEKQKYLFRDSIDAQMKNAGITSGPLQEVPGGKSPVLPYSLVRWKGSGTCSFSQLLNLLAVLKENPYLVGIEELRITNTQQQRNSAAGSRGGPTGQPASRGGATGQPASRGGASALPAPNATPGDIASGQNQRGGGRGQSQAVAGGSAGTQGQIEFELTVSTLAK